MNELSEVTFGVKDKGGIPLDFPANPLWNRGVHTNVSVTLRER